MYTNSNLGNHVGEVIEVTYKNEKSSKIICLGSVISQDESYLTIRCTNEVSFDGGETKSALPVSHATGISTPISWESITNIGINERTFKFRPFYNDEDEED